jgi:hypothetical protein
MSAPGWKLWRSADDGDDVEIGTFPNRDDAVRRAHEDGNVEYALYRILSDGNMLLGTMEKLWLKRELVQYQITDLSDLGWLRVTEVGEENMYFVLQNGTHGFVKVDR